MTPELSQVKRMDVSTVFLRTVEKEGEEQNTHVLLALKGLSDFDRGRRRLLVPFIIDVEFTALKCWLLDMVFRREK